MKKVLSVLLALVMVFSLVAVSANATIATDASFKIELKPTESSYSKGDIVTIEVWFETSGELGLVGCAGDFFVGFDQDVFEPIEDISTSPKWNASNTVVLAGYPAENNNNTTLAFTQIAKTIKLSASEQADKKWDSVLRLAGSEAAGPDDDYSTAQASFAFKLKIKDDADDAGGWTLGIPTGYIDEYDLQISEANFMILCGASGPDYGLSTAKIFDTPDTTITVGAASYDPAYLKTQCQWADGNTAGTLNVGVSATFSTANFPVELSTNAATPNLITSIDSVGMDVTAGAYTSVAETKYVYEVDATTYRYRAVITGVPHDATGEITVTFWVQVNGTKTYGETKTLNLGDIITASTNAGLPAYTGA